MGCAFQRKRGFMRIGWQKLLVASALSGLGVLSACTVEIVDGPPAGVGGTAGSAGTGGTGGSKGDAAPEGGAPDGAVGDGPGTDSASTDGPGSDGTADSVTTEDAVDGPATDLPTTDASSDALMTPDGSAGDGTPTDAPMADVPSDTAGGCFAEDLADAGSSNDCSSLPYYGTQCRDDAGVDWPSAGAALCDTLNSDLKATAFQELLVCLKALPGADGGAAACGSAHEQGAADCSRGIFNRSMCPVPESVVEAGLYGCAQIAASCGPDSGNGGISVELCQAWLGAFHATARQGIIDCYLDPTDVGATSCRDKFENYCVFP